VRNPRIREDLHRSERLAEMLQPGSCTTPRVFCPPRLGARTLSIRPSGVNSLCNALGIDLPRWRLVGARGPVAQGPDGMMMTAIMGDSCLIDRARRRRVGGFGC
jgi:hypothetical protein